MEKKRTKKHGYTCIRVFSCKIRMEIAAISEYLNRDRFGTEKVQYNSAA